LATPLAAIQARYLLAALTSWVGERIRGRVVYQAWLTATLKQFRQVPLTTGLGYLLGAMFLAAYLLTWHGGRDEQHAVLYLFQAGIGGVGTNVVVALATVQGRNQQQPPSQPQPVSSRRQRGRMWGLAAMILVSIIPVMLILYLFITVGLFGDQGGYIGWILNIMIVGIAGLTAALTNWFSYQKQTGRPPVASWKPRSWGDEDWQRLGDLAELYWTRELIPGVLRTGAFFLGFPVQGLYQSTAVHPTQQLAQLVLSASQQGFAALLNLPAVAIRNAPAGWIRSLLRRA
jgi:hypothetical protein